MITIMILRGAALAAADELPAPLEPPLVKLIITTILLLLLLMIIITIVIIISIVIVVVAVAVVVVVVVIIIMIISLRWRSAVGLKSSSSGSKHVYT